MSTLANWDRAGGLSTFQKAGDRFGSSASDVGVAGLDAGGMAVSEWAIHIAARPISKQASICLIMLIYFVSGACSLIDEVVWVRLLKLTLGNTVYASSIVVSTFMAGLAIGALVMSRYCDRIRRRLRWYALLEALITLSALSLPWGLRLADTVYVRFYRIHDPSQAQLLLVQVIISAGILLVPSMLMGSTLPLLGRFVTSLEKEAGHLVGRLYALNTLGAAIGCFLAGFVLIRALGVMGTLYTAAILNLTVAGGGLCLSKCQAEDPVVEGTKIVVAKSRDWKFHLLILAFFMSGLISIGYELLWMRSVIHMLSAYTYVFSGVLTVYLLGNVVGAGIGSGLVKQVKNPAIGFAITLSLLGLCGIFYLPWLLWWTSDLLPAVNRELALAKSLIPFSIYMVKPLVQSIFLFLPPAIIMGAGFPLALQAWTNHIHKVGRSTGTAYGANTTGAVVGGIVTGFICIPLLGLQWTISVLGLAGVWVAAAVYLSFADRRTSFGHLYLLAVVVLSAAFVVGGPRDLFERVVNSNPGLLKQLRLLAMEEGTATTVSVYRHREEGTLHLYTSGQKIAGDTYYWRGDQKMLGHFGPLLNSHAKKVLSVGFGTGESTACLALHGLERVDCVEIAPEVVEVSLRFFRHINLGDRLHDEVNMIYMDAKNFIHLTDIKYDAIVNDSIHPRQFAENASLYTKEYFEIAKAHLNDRGLFVNWIPTHNVEPVSVLNSIIGTMMEVFPHLTLWYMTTHPAPYFLVIGSEQPQYFSPMHIESELLKDDVSESLSLIDVNTSMDVLSCYIADDKDLSRHIRSYPVNSDYRPYIEFATDQVAGGTDMFRRFILAVRSGSVYDHIDWTGLNEERKDRWLSDFSQLYEASTYLLRSNGTDSYLEKLTCSVKGLAVLPGNAGLLDLRNRSEHQLLAQCLKLIESNRQAQALALAEKALQIHPQSSVAWIVRSSTMQRGGDMPGALEAARTAVQFGPNQMQTHWHLASILFDAGQSEEAIAEYKEAARLAERAREAAGYNRARLLKALAAAYAAAGRLAEAIATTEEAFDAASSSNCEEIAQDIKQYQLLLSEMCPAQR